MERRQFLGTLFASLGVLAIDPADLLWHPVEHPAPLLDRHALVGLTAITTALTDELSLLWHPRRAVSSTGLDAKAPHQLAVDMHPPTDLDPEGLDREQYVYPAARALALAIEQRHLTTCGRLPILPARIAHAVTVTRGKLSVRGLYQPWAAEMDYPLLRFDVLGG